MSFLRVLTIVDVVRYLTSKNFVRYVVPGFWERSTVECPRLKSAKPQNG